MFKIVYDDDDGDTGRVCLIYSYFFLSPKVFCICLLVFRYYILHSEHSLKETHLLLSWLESREVGNVQKTENIKPVSINPSVSERFNVWRRFAPLEKALQSIQIRRSDSTQIDPQQLLSTNSNGIGLPGGDYW